MEILYTMYNFYDEEAEVIETAAGRYTYSIEGSPAKRDFFTLEEVTNILYKNGFRF